MNFSKLKSLFFTTTLMIAGSTAAIADDALHETVLFSDLATTLTIFFDEEGLGESSRFSCVIGDAVTGEIYLLENGDLGMEAGSLSKLVTSAAAFDTLGWDYRTETQVIAEGPINEDGILAGNLVLKGGGDPTLASPLMADDDHALYPYEQFAARLKEEYGLRRIQGSVIGDATRYVDDRSGIGWDFAERGAATMAEISALQSNYGVIEIEFDSNRKPGKRVYTELYPDIDYIYLENTVLVSEPDNFIDPIRFVRQEETGIHSVFGSMPPGIIQEIGTAVHDGARFSATLFDEALQDNGIKAELGPGVRYRTLQNNVEEVAPDAILTVEEIQSLEVESLEEGLEQIEEAPYEPQLLLKTFSPKLVEWVRSGLVEDRNLIFEVILREMAIARNYPTNFEGAADNIMMWAEENGYRRNQFVMVDGSGQSSYNMIPPLTLYDLLLEWQGRSRKQRAFQSVLPGMEPLPQSDVSRHFRNAFTGIQSTRGNAIGVAGYYTNLKGERFVVVLMIDRAISPGITLERMLQQIDRSISLL